MDSRSMIFWSRL